MSVLAPPPSPSPSSCFDAMLSDSDINIDRTMATNSLKRKSSSTNKPQSVRAAPASSSDAENRPIVQTATPKPTRPTKPTEPAKAEAAPTKYSQTSSSPSEPAAKKLKLSNSTNPLVELKNGKLILKQKAFNWSLTMPVLKAVISFQEFLDEQDKLDEISAQHLHVIAKLTQESDKSLMELAKTIRGTLMPEAEVGSSDSQSSAASSSSKSKLSLPVIQAAINAVAERKNYGIDSSTFSRKASTSTGDVTPTVPASLQLWRWEVTDTAMLPADLLEKLTDRRTEREDARVQAQELLSNLKEEDRQALLSKHTKTKISASVAKDKPCSSASTPSKSKAGTAGSISQPISIDDDMDDGSVADTEQDETAPGATTLSTPVASRKRKSASFASTPQPSVKSSASTGDASTSSSPKEKRKAKEPSELCPEKQKEKEEKDAVRAERMKVKEAKRLEREAKELEKQKAKEAKEAEQKKVEEQKKRQANFLTSFVKKAAPKSPTKAVAGTAVASSSGAAKAVENVSDFHRAFLPCQYKDLAPINRFASQSKIVEIARQDLSKEEMLSQFLTRAKVTSSSGTSHAHRRKGVHPPISVREIKRIVTESDVLGGNAQEQAAQALETLQDRNKVQVKLLQFESDRRPGWYGTWTKSTNLIGPRCPLGQDPVSLDYSYDSDADWEELGQVEGEDVQDGEEKEESVLDDDEDSEMDDWLVDDLEVEEEEEARLAANVMDADDEIVEVDFKGTRLSPVAVTTNLLHPKKKKKVKLLGRRFDSKLVPFSTGPHWEIEFGKCEYELFSSYRIEFLNDAGFGLNPFTFCSAEPTDVSPTVEDTAVVHTSTKVRKAAMPAGGVLAALWGEATSSGEACLATTLSKEGDAKLSFKHTMREDAIPALLKGIDGSTKTRAGLVDDLKELLDKLGKSASKNAIGERISGYATKEKKVGSCWVVKDEFRELVG
ncbi:uncharacterized protein MEPE_00233 [Melanopsichium pennsylvanicum]|uniref:Chromatin assembly factor 1 subunit A dimerization domain-containing protein n=2 Tax=Melanopsichium pennsylvanicum TaxID=63383 RepID=A0AAJ4XG64_9BASI|nr:conserved hypothetical protein [Melanopsichium pennsylvanicum 4]SNX81528.1 uncharacterized protein MEPE_00233 [Melanopsichium pennsylvanicum]